LRVSSFKRFAIIAMIGFAFISSTANAETFTNLVKDGFSVGKITNSKSGQPGWNVSKGDKKYFCKANISSVYIDSEQMYSFTSSGRPILGSRKVFDKIIGGSDPNIPYWKDLQAGRVKPSSVGDCLLVQ
jgi:hypothetical protein